MVQQIFQMASEMEGQNDRNAHLDSYLANDNVGQAILVAVDDRSYQKHFQINRMAHSLRREAAGKERIGHQEDRMAAEGNGYQTQNHEVF